MNTYLHIIEKRIRRRKQLRFAAFSALVLLPVLGLLGLQLINAQNERLQYAQADIPAISAVQMQLVDTNTTNASILTQRSAKPAPESKQVEKEESPKKLETLPPAEASIKPRLQAEATAKPKLDLGQETGLPSKALQKEKVVEEEPEHYISMPAFEQLPLKSKMNLMRNTAYSPADKRRLKKHIIGLFDNKRARVDVIKTVSGTRETQSYPIGMYLDRLDAQPAIQFRLAEKVMQGGQLSGLVVRE
ncbi:MAG: hypothetical protein AAFO91_19290 [Bacteroidota bacterium]